MDLSKVIKSINSNAEFSIMENDINQITWLNGTTPISKADIEAKMTELQAEYDAEELILELFLATVRLLDPKVPLASMITIS